MSLVTFKTAWRNDGHDWSVDGEKITDPKKLEMIKGVLEKSGPIIVEHWHYCGGRAPDRMIFDDYEEFVAYLKEKAVAGDAIHIWDAHPLLRDDNELVHGKCPAEDGAVPKGGAY